MNLNRRYLLSLAGLATLAGAIPGCGVAAPVPAQAPASGQPAKTGTYTRVSPAELTTMMAKKDFPLINVHVPYEGELEGTDKFIPYDQIAANLDKLPSDKGAKIVLYCRSGSMSTTAANTLVGLGYTNVYELNGGMYAWKDAGLQVVEKAGR
jgi:phage shock protein E